MTPDPATPPEISALPSETELATIRHQVAEFLRSQEALGPAVVLVTSAKFSGPLLATDVTPSIPTTPAFPGQLVYGSYPTLAAALEDFAPPGSSMSHPAVWATWVDAGTWREVIDSATLAAELEAVRLDEHAYEAKLRTWVFVHTGLPRGELEPGIPARTSLARLLTAARP